MARVMIIGYGPLPRPGLTYMAAPALRTRQFLKPILEAGHTVNLYTLPLKPDPGPGGDLSAMVPDSYEGLSFQRFTNSEPEFAVAQLTEQARQIKPDAIVGVNTFPSFVAARLPVRVPLWADLNGYWMAEVQGKCRAEASDNWLSYAWSVERTIVRRLDKFSAVSRSQIHAVTGELASVGRLNQHTFDYPFGHHVPNAAYRWETGMKPGEDVIKPILRGPIVPTDAFVILWSGGFNVGADIPTLVEAMNLLMARYPMVHFVSTGGRVEGQASRPYDEFEERVGASPFKDRYHLLGWVESEKLPSIYHEADLGINVDARNYETLFGARSRINAMAAMDLAVATTIGTEISEWLDDAKAILPAPIGDPQALAETIEPWIDQREGLRTFARNAVRVMKQDFSYNRTTRRLIDWLTDPAFAPDNQVKIERGGDGLEDLSEIALNPLEEEAMLMARHGLDKLREALAANGERAGHRSVTRFLFGSRRGK
ncbi:MAG: hypothetical protein ABFD69_01865 [Candidatus Sumerlaeia bacterium]